MVAYPNPYVPPNPGDEKPFANESDGRLCTAGNGTRASKSIRQVVAGTGGEPGGDEIFRKDAPNVQVVEPNAFGVLRLSLRPASYAVKFVAGENLTDSGNGSRHWVVLNPLTTRPG